MTTRFGDGGTVIVGGRLAGAVKTVRDVSVSFAGSAGLTANALNTHNFIYARFDGVANLAPIGALKASVLNARFSGASTLSVWAGQSKQFIQARFGAVASVSANVTFRYKALSIRLQGAGEMSVEHSARHVIFRGPGPGEFNDDYNDDFAIGINRWPSSLPQCPLLDGFVEQKQANIISFKPDVGTMKFRRRCSNAAWVASMAFKFNETQLETFQSFRLVTCMDGAYGFQMLHPVTKVNYWWNWNKKEAPVVERIAPKAFLVRFDLVNLKQVA